jgi:hypothetical protein
MESMYYIGLDVHKKTISYCVKDGSGRIHAEGVFTRVAEGPDSGCPSIREKALSRDTSSRQCFEAPRDCQSG